MLKTPLLAAVIVAATALGAAAPANAKSVSATITVGPAASVHAAHHRSRHHIMPRRAVVRGLYRRGYRDVHRVHFRNGYWRARAYGRRGLIALTIHPRTGQVLKRRVVRQHRPLPYHHRYRHGRGSLTFSFGIH